MAPCHACTSKQCLSSCRAEESNPAYWCNGLSSCAEHSFLCRGAKLQARFNKLQAEAAKKQEQSAAQLSELQQKLGDALASGPDADSTALQDALDKVRKLEYASCNIRTLQHDLASISVCQSVRCALMPDIPWLQSAGMERRPCVMQTD